MSPSVESISCPATTTASTKILLGHGSGGKLSAQLIDGLFLPTFGRPSEIPHDSAMLPLGGQQLAFTTDSYVVNPLFFPGGNIGDLAVNGTVNDLAMCGAKPLWLSCGFILEEGLEIEKLKSIVESMKNAADKADVQIVTGDTKVVERGKGDGLYINTSGVGVFERMPIKPENIQPGDLIIVNGDIGRHGIAIMSVREGLTFDAAIESDTQELSSLVQSLIQIEGLHCMRDVTRGGLATVLVELAEACALSFEIDETKILVSDSVRGACEFLGLDPLYVACEGRFVAFIEEAHANEALDFMKASGYQPCIAGQVQHGGKGQVVAKTPLGTRRRLDRLPGDQLPRIC